MSRPTTSLASSPVSRHITGTPTAQSTPSLWSSSRTTSRPGSPLRRTHLPAVSQQQVQDKLANLLNSSHRAPTPATTRLTATPPHRRPLPAAQQARPPVHPTLPPREVITGKLMGQSVSSSPLGSVICLEKPQSRQQLGADSRMSKTATWDGNAKNSQQGDTSLHNINPVRANTEHTPRKASSTPISPSCSLLVTFGPSDEHPQRPSASSDFLKEEIRQTSTPRIFANPHSTSSLPQNKRKEEVTLPAQEPKLDKKDLVPKESSPPRITERIMPEKVESSSRAETKEVSCREFMDSMVALSELELELPHSKLSSIQVRSNLEKWIAESRRDPTRFVFKSDAPEECNWRYNGYQYGDLTSDIEVLDRALLSLSNLWPTYARNVHFQVFQLKFMKARLIEGDCAKEMVECLESTLLDRVARGLRQIDKLADLLLNGQCPRVPSTATGLLVQLKRRRDKYRQKPNLSTPTLETSKTSRTVASTQPGSITSLRSSPPQGPTPSSPKSSPIKLSPTRSDIHVHLPPANSVRPTSVLSSTLPKSPQEETSSIFFSSTESSNGLKGYQQPWTPSTAVEPKNSLLASQPVTSNLPCATPKNRDTEQPTISLPSTTWLHPSNSLATSARQPPGILQMGVTAAAVSHSYGYKKPVTTSSSGLEKVENGKKKERSTLEHTVPSKLGLQSNTKRNPLVKRIDLAAGTRSPPPISPTPPSKVLSHLSSPSPLFLRTPELHQLNSPTPLPPAITTCSSSTVPTSTSVRKLPRPLQIGKTAAEVPHSYCYQEEATSPIGESKEGKEHGRDTGDQLPHSMPTSKPPSSITKDPKPSMKISHRKFWAGTGSTATSQSSYILPAPSPMPTSTPLFMPPIWRSQTALNKTPATHHRSSISLDSSQSPKLGTTPTYRTKTIGRLKTPLFSHPNHLGLPMLPSLEPSLSPLTAQLGSWTSRQNKKTSVQSEDPSRTASVRTISEASEEVSRKFEYWDTNTRVFPDFSPERKLYSWSTSPSIQNRIFAFDVTPDRDRHDYMQISADIRIRE